MTATTRYPLRAIVRTLVLALVATTLSACNIISLDSFALHEIKIVDFNLSEGATVEMTIENRSIFNVTVVGGELSARHKGSPIGQIYLRRPVKLPKRATTTVKVDIGMRFSSPLQALQAVGALTKNPDEVTVSGYGEGKVWFLRKRFEREDVPLSKFITIFGAPSNYL